MNYQDIKNVKELYDYLNTFKYGVSLDKIYYNDEVNQHIGMWKLRDIEDIISSQVGICYDFVEIERDWFTKHHYKFVTIFFIFAVDYENSYPTHTLLAYEENNKWYHFEVADFYNRGIHEYNSLKDLVATAKNRQITCANLSDSEIKNNLEVYIYNQPKLNSSFTEYIDSIMEQGEKFK